VPPGTFEGCVEQVRRHLFTDLGVATPPIELCVDETSEPRAFHLDLEGVPVTAGEMPSDCVLVECDPVHLDMLAIRITKARRRWDGGDDLDRSQSCSGAQRVEHRLSLATGSARQVFAHTLRRYAPHFIGIQETQALLAAMESEYPELVKEALSAAPLHKIAEILRGWWMRTCRLATIASSSRR